MQWNRAAERVEAVSALWFDEIAIEESRGAPDPEAAAALLAAKAMEAGLARFTDVEEIDAFLDAPDSPPARDCSAARRRATRWPRSPMASRVSPSWKPPRAAADWSAHCENQCPPRRAGCWRRSRPERIRLPGGRQVRVHYEPGQPPWIASRLQDFFGMRETPAVARGAVPLVVRLLAPNQRPVQMTTDLAGFWQRLYPQVRKEVVAPLSQAQMAGKPLMTRRTSHPRHHFHLAARHRRGDSTASCR